jgi:hypothetical protein
MTLARDLPPASPLGLDIDAKGALQSMVANPVTAFLALSILLGLSILIVNPPLRGPDESAQFLRVFGIAAGDVIPSTQDEQGRRGLFIPASIYEDYIFFETARQKFGTPGFNFRAVVHEYTIRRSATVAEEHSRLAVADYLD